MIERDTARVISIDSTLLFVLFHTCSQQRRKQLSTATPSRLLIFSIRIRTVIRFEDQPSSAVPLISQCTQFSALYVENVIIRPWTTFQFFLATYRVFRLLSGRAVGRSYWCRVPAHWTALTGVIWCRPGAPPTSSYNSIGDGSSDGTRSQEGEGVHRSGAGQLSREVARIYVTSIQPLFTIG